MLAILTLICWSCRQEDHNSKRVQAVNLYYKSVSLLNLYTDSLSHAGDSVAVIRLSDRLNNQLALLNFEFPSETDFEITEGENDTLMSLTEKYVLLRDSLLYAFAHPAVSPDSLATDSIVKKEVNSSTLTD